MREEQRKRRIAQDFRDVTPYAVDQNISMDETDAVAERDHLVRHRREEWLQHAAVGEMPAIDRDGRHIRGSGLRRDDIQLVPGDERAGRRIADHPLTLHDCIVTHEVRKRRHVLVRSEPDRHQVNLC